MPTMKAMTITADSLLPRPKLDYDVGYDAAIKGASVVVSCPMHDPIGGVVDRATPKGQRSGSPRASMARGVLCRA
jgi:hypothetical protein